MSANELTLDASLYPVNSATIFQSSIAELTRTFDVDLKSGNNVIRIFNVSSHLDAESPRMYALGNMARISDIHCDTTLSLPTVPENYRYSAKSEAIKAAETKRKTLETERAIRQQESALLEDAARASLNDKPFQLGHIRETFISHKREIASVIMELDEQIAALEKETWLLENSYKGETAAVIVATVIAERDVGGAQLQLTYLVTGVSWRPQYDLYARTSGGRPSPEVTLHLNAIITQTSGEEWDVSVLTLSTASSQTLSGLSLPAVDPVKVSLVGQKPVLQLKSALNHQSSGPAAQRHAMPTTPAPPLPIGLSRTTHRAISAPGAIPQRLVTVATPVPLPSSRPVHREDQDVHHQDNDHMLQSLRIVHDRSPLSALAYYVDGMPTVSLPSDGMKHKISIAALDLPVTLTYTCVPRKSTAVFIGGTIHNIGDYELLQGPLNVFMDGRFVTKTSLSHVGVRESFDCILGVDAPIKVSYQTVSHTESVDTTLRTVTTTVTNGHQYDITELIVRDVVPTTDEAGINVVLRKPPSLARAKEPDEELAAEQSSGTQDAEARWMQAETGTGGEKDGMYEWVCRIRAGEEVKLEAEWEVKAPNNVRWEETSNKPMLLNSKVGEAKLL